MSSILVAGVAVLDFVFHMESFPRQAEKYRADGAAISGGGNAANAAVAIVRNARLLSVMIRFGVVCPPKAKGFARPCHPTF